LALVGRRGIATEEARRGVAALEEMGVAVRVCPVDVSKETAVVEMIAEISAAMPAIRGVVHAAMVLDDGIVLRLNWDRLHKVMAPKVAGAWNLHHATLSLDLDFFILYSSATTLIGSPGQANYVAANMYLESLAAFRRALGKPALAVGWGAIGEVGYIARNPSVAEAARGRLGVENLKPAGALAALERLFAAGATSVTAAFINWPAYIQGLPSLSSPRAIEILGAASDQPDNSEDFLSALDRAPAAERESLVIQRLNAHFGKVLGTTDSSIDGERRLSELGLDSLMAVEVAQHIERDMKLDVPIMELIQSGSLRKIAESILNGYRKQKPQSDAPVHSRETLETT
jgi:acyl carrier protein